MRTSKLLLAACFLVLAGLLCGCKKSKPTEAPAEPKAGPTKEPDNSPKKDNPKVGGKERANEMLRLSNHPGSFTAPPGVVKAKLTASGFIGQKAVEKHDEQWVEITGMVQMYGYHLLEPEEKDQLVKLVDKLSDTDGVFCYTPGVEPWATLAVGQTVTIKGYSTTLFSLGGPSGLLDCKVVSAGKSPAMICSAEELVRAAIQGDKQLTPDKPLKVTGEVTAVSKNPRDNYAIKLKGVDGVEVYVGTEVEFAKLFSLLKVGQKVKLAGSYFGHRQEDKAVSIIHCYLINEK